MNRPVTPVTVRLRPRYLLAVVGAAALVGVGACSSQSPTQTLVPYQPADGVAAHNGVVEARDLVVVAKSKGAEGRLSGSLINRGDTPVTVTFMTREQSEAGSTSGSQVELRGREQKPIESVQFASVPNPPGALTDIVISGQAGKTLVSVPVLLPDGYYSTVTPTGTPAPAATGTTSATTGTGTETTAAAG